MAWAFDGETETYVSIADNTALTFPDSDWSLGGWVKFGTQTDNYPYLIGWGSYGVTPSFNWLRWIGSNDLYIRLWDDDGSTISFNSTGNPVLNTAWQYVILIRSGTTVTQYINGAVDGSESNPNFDGVDVSGSLRFGIRGNVPANYSLVGSMAEGAKWDRALGVGEIAALVNGVRPWMFVDSLKWYVPMATGGPGGCYQDWGPNRLTVTNNGSTHANHPPTSLWTPWAGLPLVETAPGGFTIPIAMHHYKQLMGAN